jgi:DNA-binding PadR family transcriptional regulator
VDERLTITVPVAKVLAALLSEPTADRYGLDLMKATGLPSGTLYPILVRLERAGWLRAHWEDVDPVRAGRPARRYYRLSADGVTHARTGLAALHAQTRPANRTHPATNPATSLRSAW